MSQTNETRSCVICTMSHDTWLAQQVEDYMRDCEPTVVGVHQEPQDGEIASEPIFNCEDCENDECEYWEQFHE